MSPTRPIAILAVLQISTIIVGFVALRWVLGSFGWENPGAAFRFSEMAIFLGSYSPILLLVPLLWTLLSSWAGARDFGSPLSKGLLIAGGGLFAFFFLAYLTAIVSPGHQPLTIGR